MLTLPVATGLCKEVANLPMQHLVKSFRPVTFHKWGDHLPVQEG